MDSEAHLERVIDNISEERDQLEAENERLRELVIRAYAEGFGDAWAIAHENLNQVAEHDICWGLSHARAALQPKKEI